VSTRFVLGHVLPSKADALAPHLDELAKMMTEHTGIAIERRGAPSYEALANDVRSGAFDMAWLPPIVFVRLGDAVLPIGSILRGGKATYEASLIVQKNSRIKTIDMLRGSRAGWVDPWSAAGFVLPRVKLALLGVDPRSLFRAEKFHGSHRAAIQALVDGACDVVGTYARADEKGKVVGGAWSDIEGADVRVLATFGAIPPDVVAVRSQVPEETREKLAAALRAACADPALHPLLEDIFGGHELSAGLAPGYDSLRKALEMATGRGLFD
jgi:phosphate/phosphite/phosphonate ABC transporter binding protein